MSPEVIWLQLGSIVILYWASKVIDPDMNRFRRIISTVPMGTLAGYGFWKSWMILQGSSALSTISDDQLPVYVLTQMAAVFVVGGLGLLIHRLFAK